MGVFFATSNRRMAGELMSEDRSENCTQRCKRTTLLGTSV